MLPDLLLRRQTHFVLWRPGACVPPPTLYIGQPQAGSAEPYANYCEIPLRPEPDFPDLWTVAARDCQLQEGEVYHYWFRVRNTLPYDYASRDQILYSGDPLATTVDRRWLAPIPPEPAGVSSRDPASVILYRDGRLIPSDVNGKTAVWAATQPPPALPANNRLVIYELPARWTKAAGEALVGVGAFRDVLALLQPEATPPDFPDIPALGRGRAYLQELGINALELLPPADSPDILEWGYGTANFFAPDFDLGLAGDPSEPTALSDLTAVVQACHEQGYRFFVDVVMAFARENPYRHTNFLDFFVQWGAGDPEQGDRDGFGGDLLKYNFWVDGYHPLTGERDHFVPSREYMKLYIAHWLEHYHVDGVRLDSVNNIANYDFLQEFKDFARAYWRDRGGAADRFLVVGEELSVPLALIHQDRLDGLWNERFKLIARQVILGRNAPGDGSFEWSVRKLIDCRYLGFTDGTQAINYLTSHDVGGFGNERLYNYLINNGVLDTERRIKLAFVCLFSAVGLPMILAGDEFADEHDLDISDEHADCKQVDPVAYHRLEEPWRHRVFEYVARLAHFRQQSEALAVNDTDFLHVDYTEGKKVVVWQRGRGAERVVVVANFSDYGTPNPLHPNSEYVIANYPATPAGKYWHEITQDRMVLPEWVGREPIFPWEAKVYTLVDA